MLCSRCGKLNPSEQERCKHCGARLLARGAERSESVEFQPFVGVDEYLIDKLSSVERQAHRSSEDVDLLVQAMDYLERNVMITRAGIAALATMLRDQGLFEPAEFRRRWRERAERGLVELNRKERYLERKAEIREAFVGKHRRRFEELLSRAEDLLLGLQSAAACAVLEEALELDPKNAPLNALLGQFRLAFGENARAAAHLELALQEKTPPKGTRTAAAILRLKEGKDSEAVRLLEKAAQADPSDASAMALLAFAKAREGRWKECAELSERSLSAQEGAAARHLRVLSLLRLKRGAEAEEALDEFVNEYPDCEAALLQKASLLWYRGWWHRGQEVLERLKALQPAGQWEALEASFREAGKAKRERMRILPLSLEQFLSLLSPEADEARLYLREVEGGL